MGMDFNLVNVEIKKANAAITVLSEEETLVKWRAIAERYGGNKKYSFQFWDELDDPGVLCIENGWEIIAGFIAPLKNICLLFELEDEKKSFFFKYGNELSEVLVESGIRDFYLCDEHMDFLICYNDHDIIVADGLAKTWLRSLRASGPMS